MEDGHDKTTEKIADMAAYGRRRVRARWPLFVLALFVGFFLAEVGVRLLNLGPPVYAAHHFEPRAGIPFTQLPDGPISYQPNVTFASVYDLAGDARGYFGRDGRITYEINQYGMRGPAVPIAKAKGVFRIVCLGDSITFGEGVRYPDTYPAQLQKLLAQSMPDRRVEVLNAGVQAYGTKEEAAFYLVQCSPFTPDVVILGFFLNDAGDFAETIRQNQAMTKDLELSMFARASRIWEILERRRRTREQQEEYFDAIRRAFASPGWAECKEVLAGMTKVSREDRFRLVVVIFPVLWELNEQYPFRDLHAEVAAACRQAGCECIDLLDVFKGRRAEDLWVHPTDQHPNEIAHRLAAERIARLLSEPPASPP